MSMLAGEITRTDAEIGRRVAQELIWDCRVDEADVQVTVSEGFVILDGTVPAYAQKLAAAEAVNNVSGVLDVENRLRVVPASLTPRSDTDIARAVEEALEWDALTPHQDIRCKVIDGWVRLDGSVRRVSERAEAERAVKNLVGVRGISNGITVTPPQVNIRGIGEAIERALERQMEREVNRIRVEVTDGTVVLTGAVRSSAERQAVIGTASHAPGVRAVEDYLFVTATP
jgi:osmotically-inducible protein OsmY